MAQTAMSRQISLLEEELGCQLFYRSHQRVTLTRAGEKFYQDMSAVLAAYDEAIQEAKRVSITMTGVLRVGIGQYEGGFVSALIQEFCQVFPSVEISVAQYRYQELVTLLLRGKLDVAFALPVSAEYLDDQPVETLELFEADLGIVVPATHPALHAEILPPDFWEKECLITLSEEDGPTSMQNLHQKMQQAGWHAVSTRRANSLESEILMLEAGVGVAILPRFLEKTLSPKLQFLPVKVPYAGRNQFVAIARKDNDSPCLKGFMKGISSSHTLAEWMQEMARQDKRQS